MNRLATCITVLTLLLPIVSAVAKSPDPARLAHQVTTQLPTGVTPAHYGLRITPDAQAMSFAGHVDIDLKVDKPTQTFTLNALDLKFGAVALMDAQGIPAAEVKKTQVRAKDQTVVVHFDRMIKQGSYRLAMDYEGVIGTQASGLFALSYETPEGKKKGLYTNFQPADARRFLPAWDEPNYKATFSLEANVPSMDLAVSNMPVESRTDLGNGRSTVRFAKSPRMSTYLLFFSSGDFERATTKEGQTELGVVTRSGSLDQAREALEASRLVLAEYNDYFGVSYPLPKMDNIAAPGRSQTFAAMENWGAIFSFESVLLIDPKISTVRDRERMFSIAAHEIAHQWFGNLVTMQWWDDLWLNEGFASWMERRTTAKLHPEWNSHLNSVVTRNWAMQQDALKTTHPVVQHIKSVDQASQTFDGITYAKGEMVISMLESFVGEDAWRAGVRSYMKQHAYGNTRSEDLWAQMDKASGQKVSAMAHDFTRQPGIPLIRVTSASCKDGRRTLELEQSEFSDDRPHKTPLRWRVPVQAQSLGHSDTARTVVVGGKGVLTLDGCTPAVVNAGQTGYFRTLYSKDHLLALSQQFDKLRTVDQLGLLQDTWALGAAGTQPASSYLDLVKNIPALAEPRVWSAVTGQLHGMHRMFEGDPVRQAAFDAFAVAKLRPVFAKLGWQTAAGDSHSSKLLRGALMRTLSTLGDSVVIAEARRRYEAQASDPGAMPAELRRTILGIVAHHADDATWNKLLADARTEKTPLVKDMLYGLLASTLDKSLARRALDLALTDEVGQTNSAAMVASVAQLHPELAFDFAVAHIGTINQMLDAPARSRYFPRLAFNSAQPSMIDKVKAYAKLHLAADARRSADEAVASITRRIVQNKRVLPSLTLWLKDNQA